MAGCKDEEEKRGDERRGKRNVNALRIYKSRLAALVGEMDRIKEDMP